MCCQISLYVAIPHIVAIKCHRGFMEELISLYTFRLGKVSRLCDHNSEIETANKPLFFMTGSWHCSKVINIEGRKYVGSLLPRWLPE